ncbi:MAG: hypothetical protein BZY79_04210 [SAR202 cluster bacterium Casp-Chloro-G4]|nr:DUF6282 family protein [Chloroflexota bacterium]MDA1228299.1 DUF6282 family protein [Chloroflexota bacterium]PKB61399.1 MAG: hypothetical protein BZY79_04210 [SAR202 cluster bacterium Casp-Chloro-G4]
MNTEIEEILKGSYDLHVHAAPDTEERRLDALEAARNAYEAEMGGFVLKSHEYPTAPLTYALNRMYPGLKVYGAIALNRSVGGVNPDAVEMAAGLGTKVVWMPTKTADYWLKNQKRGPGLTVFNDSGELTAETLKVVDIVAKNDMVLASGHISPLEAIAVFEAARAAGVTRMIATHPANVATVEQQKEMISLGAYLEYTFLACMPVRQRYTVKELMDAVRWLGLDNCIITTDFGQWMNPPPAEGMRMAIASLLNQAMSSEELTKLVKTNPAKILGED